MNNIQQVLQQQCDYGEHEFTIASDGKNCIKCKLHVAEQTELEEIKDVIAEHILTKGNQVYISGEGEEKLKHILEQALTSYADKKVQDERERAVKMTKKQSKIDIEMWNEHYKHLNNKDEISDDYDLLSEIVFNVSEGYEELINLLTNKEEE